MGSTGLDFTITQDLYNANNFKVLVMIESWLHGCYHCNARDPVIIIDHYHYNYQESTNHYHELSLPSTNPYESKPTNLTKHHNPKTLRTPGPMNLDPYGPSTNHSPNHQLTPGAAGTRHALRRPNSRDMLSTTWSNFACGAEVEVGRNGLEWLVE